MSMMDCSCAGDQYYSSVLEDIGFEGKDFKADSWSTAVDSSYLQTHRKDVIKRQDVIYGDHHIVVLATFCPWQIVHAYSLSKC